MSDAPPLTPQPLLAPTSRLAVVITCDQLPLGGFGCYGNEWVDTTACDTLAAFGFVFDNCIADQLASDDDAPAVISTEWLTDVVARGGRCIVAAADDAHPLFPTSDPVTLPGIDYHQIEVSSDAPGTPADLPFARLLNYGRTRIPELAATSNSSVLWLHSAGLPDDCVPPPEAWDLYADEFSEEPIDWGQFTDDDLVRHPAIRAAYLTLMDHWLSELCQDLKSLEIPVLLQIVGLNGSSWLPVPRTEPVLGGLEAPRIQSPWLVWQHQPAELNAEWEPGRSAAIVQPSDLGPSTLAWLEQGSSGGGVWPLIRGEQGAIRDRALTRGAENCLSVWTPQDQVIFTEHAQQGEPPFDGADIRRYWQPEDPWNVFNTAGEASDRVAEVARQIRQVVTSPDGELPESTEL